jgi:hypothetical protein
MVLSEPINKGVITSIDMAIKTTFDRVPKPGTSFRGIHNNKTATLTAKVEKPTVQPVCTETPCASTVHGLTPRPAAINIASPVPNNHSPASNALRVCHRGRKVNGASALQKVSGI